MVTWKFRKTLGSLAYLSTMLKQWTRGKAGKEERRNLWSSFVGFHLLNNSEQLHRVKEREPDKTPAVHADPRSAAWTSMLWVRLSQLCHAVFLAKKRRNDVFQNRLRIISLKYGSVLWTMKYCTDSQKNNLFFSFIP